MIIPLRFFSLASAVLFLSCGSISLAEERANSNTVTRYSQQAQQALAEKDLPAAVAALEQLARLTPNVPEVHANLGMVYYTEGRYQDAAQSFERALKLNSKIANAALMLGLCEADLGLPRKAIPLLEAGFRHPPNEEIGRTVGIKLMEMHLLTDQNLKAVEISEELLTRYPNDPEILYRASHIYGDRALQTMVRLVNVAPESPWKLLAFAEALESRTRYALAIIEYRKVIAADPSMPGVHYRLGRALLLSSQDSSQAQDEAMKEFQQALAQDPQNAGAEYEIGEIYRRHSQPQQAASHFARAVEIDSRVEEAQIALARTLISLRQPKDAVPHLLAAIELDPINELSHFLLAGAYKSLGDATKSGYEMSLYQKYHSQSSSNSSVEGGIDTALSSSAVTKQTIEAEPRQQ